MAEKMLVSLVLRPWNLFVAYVMLSQVEMKITLACNERCAELCRITVAICLLLDFIANPCFKSS
jgi:hypothetical protein